MKRNLVMFIIVTMLVGICVGCQNDNQSNSEVSDDLTTKQLEKFYPGNITNVDSIEMISGSNGNRKVINNPVEIKEWLEKIRHLVIVPDPKQEESSGVLFHVTLFEKEQEKLYITPTSINHNPIKPNPKLASLMKELYRDEK
ncbi:hypothetical protein [Paenibacillus tarimensis]|uniref:hypothetical protein n=1 Tax=Paenibacillus tarimensis TaxID=416012 RepID=UPI001F162E95|nr:hypothetical protein [Paenibacillus tarimensis]MCF2943358.1 hypothetical protein [Paenibacillus tarimensis]